MSSAPMFHLPLTQDNLNQLNRKADSNDDVELQDLGIKDHPIQVVEREVEEGSETPSLPLPPKAHIIDHGRSGSSHSQTRGPLLPPLDTRALRGPSPPPRPYQMMSPVPQRTLSNTTNASHGPSSDPPPIRSIFPRYNPNLPPNKQAYRPQPMSLPGPLPRAVLNRSEYNASPSLQSQNRIDVTVGPRTAPASILSFPFEESGPKSQFVNLEDLAMLWDIANGQNCGEDEQEFNLKMHRGQSSLFTFGTSIPHRPFYTLQTFNTDITIRRTHPLKPRLSVPIMILHLEPPSRRLPPADGLVTTIFPKLAAMLAIDQAAEMVEANNMTPQEAEIMAQAAVQRAAESEACKLIWSDASNRYELYHPQLTSLLSDSNQQPTSSSPSEPLLPFHIIINPTSLTDPTPQIELTHPNNPSPSSILASFSLSTHTLTLRPDLYNPLLPNSLYATDVITSTLIAISLVDPSCNPVLASLPLSTESYDLPPTRSLQYSPTSSTTTTSISVMKQKNKKKKKNNKRGANGFVEDVEKFAGIAVGGYYESENGEKVGEKMPFVVRGFVKLIYWGFKMLLWMVGVAFNVLYAILIGLGKCVGTEAGTK
ncbi:MAG: hypothetical protein M1834_002119 [Cirrosporium novae-zelandiae]|nr:MAG: hypothetical protein M1834_002119 [Cirrosporium novae-zelandiae]